MNVLVDGGFLSTGLCATNTDLPACLTADNCVAYITDLSTFSDDYVGGQFFDCKFCTGNKFNQSV